jgi:hypothetical protein
MGQCAGESTEVEGNVKFQNPCLPAGRQMSNECQMPQCLPAVGRQNILWNLSFGFDLTFELCHLKF